MSSPARKRRPTIIDVAAAAGVSDATVSRTLAGDAAVREATKQKVLEAARQLGYRPNASARGLKMGSHSALGVFCEGGSWMLYNEHYGPLLAGLADEAGVAGVRLVLYFAEVELAPDLNPHHGKVRLRGLEALADGRVDGGVIVGGDFSDLKTMTLLRKEGFPLVGLGADIPNQDFPHVASGLGTRIRAALDVLAAQGHRRIGYVGIAKDSRHNKAVEDAFAAAAKEGLIEHQPGGMLYPVTYDLLDPVELKALLQKGLASGCSAFVTATVYQASIVRDLLEGFGKRLPQDLSLITFGFEPDALRARSQHLSVIYGDLYEAGRQCFRIYQQVLEGKKPASQEISWLWRPNGHTVGPAPR